MTITLDDAITHYEGLMGFVEGRLTALYQTRTALTPETKGRTARTAKVGTRKGTRTGRRPGFKCTPAMRRNMSLAQKRVWKHRRAEG